MRRLLLLLALATLAGCGGSHPPRSGQILLHRASGPRIVHYRLRSRFVGQTVDQTLVLPRSGGRGRPLLVLLHSRGGSGRGFLSPQFFSELNRLGNRAPVVLIPGGGRASYFHDRREGAWGSYVVREAIPAARRRADASRRTAIGGISMGGFGALDLARLYPRVFCAVGGHAAALFFRAADTPQGAFDDATDFANHDVIGAAAQGNPYGRMWVWIDVGRDDPFRDADTTLAHELRIHGGRVTFQLHDGGHSGWSGRMAEYLRFYARALATCAR